MFFPIRDDQPRFSTPLVNYFIIALNIAVFVFFELPNSPEVVTQYALVPAHLTRAIAANPHYPVGPNILTIFSSMFLHGDVFHILGNMWILWIFGDNVEDYLGHFSYLVFYLVGGIAAALTDVALTSSSNVPMIGASGAIAGVMGAYFLLYPRAKVLTWAFIIFFWWLPAWIWLGIWFLQQLQPTALLATGVYHQKGGVAVAAHTGGFIAGLVLIKIFPRRTYTQRYGTW